MLRVNQKKIISLLLVGVNIIIDNGNSFIDVLNSIDIMPTYKDNVSNLIVENDNNIKPLSENNISTGILIRNIDSNSKAIVCDTLFKITDKNGFLISYVKFERDPLVVDLKPGNYYLSEVNNNMSYLLRDKKIPFSVFEDKINEVVFENEKSKSGAIIYCIDGETLKNVKNLYVAIIDKNDNVYNFVIFGDPYRVVLAPGSYTIVIDDMSGEYNNQQICSYFTIKDNEYEKLEFKFNKDVKTKVK